MEQQIQYKYAKMELAQFAIFEENLENPNGAADFQTEVQFEFEPVSCLFCCQMIVKMTQHDKLLTKAELRSYFDIHSDSVKELCQGKQIVFSPYFLVQIASLCYGAMRGVLHVKTVSSSLNKFILPPFYFAEIIDKDFIVEMPSCGSEDEGMGT